MESSCNDSGHNDDKNRIEDNGGGDDGISGEGMLRDHENDSGDHDGHSIVEETTKQEEKEGEKKHMVQLVDDDDDDDASEEQEETHGDVDSGVDAVVMNLRRAHQKRPSDLSSMIAKHEKQQRKLEEAKEQRLKVLHTVKKSLLMATSKGHSASSSSLTSVAAAATAAPPNATGDHSACLSSSAVTSKEDAKAVHSFIQPIKDKNELHEHVRVEGDHDGAVESDSDDATERDMEGENTEDDLSIAIRNNPLLVLRVLFRELQVNFRIFLSNLQWRQKYYFYIHVVYIVLMSTVGGILLWISENHISPSKDRPYLRFIDALFMGTSAHCVTGLIVVDFSKFSALGQVISMCLMVLGGITLTCIPALIIKIIRARNRMMMRRRQLNAPDVDEIHRRALEHRAKLLMSTMPTRSTSRHSDPNKQQNFNSLKRVDAEEMDDIPVRATFDVQFGGGDPYDDEPVRKTYDVERRRTLVPQTHELEFTDVQLEEGAYSGVAKDVADAGHDNRSRIRKRWKGKTRNKKKLQRLTAEERMARAQKKRIKEILSYRPPPATDVEFLALCAILCIVLATVFVIGATSFMFMSAYLHIAYGSAGLDNLNPWWIGLFLTISGFNNVGIAPFADNMARFISDPVVCILIMFLVLSGNTCFPAIMRFIVYMLFRFGPKRYRLVFKYLLLNHHHLTLHLYPSLQTKLYLATTIMLNVLGILIAFTLEFWSGDMLALGVGTRLLVVCFQTINTRASGFTTYDIAKWGEGTLLFYIIMMRIKPQMACALQERAYGIAAVIRKFYTSREREEILRSAKKYDKWSAHDTLQHGGDMHSRFGTSQLQQHQRHSNITIHDWKTPMTVDSGKPVADGSIAASHAHGITQASVHSLYEPERSNDAEVNDIIDEILDYGEYDDGGGGGGDTLEEPNEVGDTLHDKLLARMRRFKRQLHVLYLSAILHVRNLFLAGNVWLFIFMLIICMIESSKIKSDPARFSFFKVAFEVVSAFGNVGMSLGYEGLRASFSAVLTDASKILIIVTIVFGRHRGLLGSMKDQEYHDFSVTDIVHWWYDEKKRLLEREEEKSLLSLRQSSGHEVEMMTVSNHAANVPQVYHHHHHQSDR